jgi:hypothetical protein
MAIVERASAITLAAVVVALVAVCADKAVRRVLAEEALRPAHSIDLAARACLNQKERRALIEAGAVMQLTAAMHAVRSHVPGTLVRARLCRRGEGFAYVLTVLGHDGKVTRVVVDAVKGTLVGER